jgi:hypothetical protein
MKRSVLGLAFTLALAAPAQAATSFEPGLHWKVLESAHFRVNYPEGLEDIGRRVLAIAEDAHRKDAPFMGLTTYEKTDIVCFDTYDDTNANADNYPHNRIHLNLHPPSPDAGFPIGRYDDWIRYVVTHEYTHILHKNETPWAITELNAILGSALFSQFSIPGVPSYVQSYIPNLLSDPPRFITEGLAVTTESKFTPGGRAKEGDFDTHLRMASLEDRLYTIDQVNGTYLLDWPSGGNEYDYGMPFFQYLIHTYGEDKPAKIVKVMGTTPWLGINLAVARVLPGKTCAGLWNEMIAWLKQRYAVQVQEIQRSPLTRSTQLTHTGRHHHHPKWLSDGRLSVTESLKGVGSFLTERAAMPGARATRLFSTDPTGDYSWTGDGRYTYYSIQNSDEHQFTSFSDLYRYDTQTKHSTRLTTSLRAVEPAISPDGQSLVAVATTRATNHLVVIDPVTKKVRSLTPPRYEVNYANPSWAPDGKSILVSRWFEGHYHVVSVDPATGAETELTTGNALDFYPAYTPDGKWITFNSDRSGVMNVFALRVADHALFQVTNVLGSAGEAALSPDGKQLAFIGYSGPGYDLHVMPWDPATFRPVDMDEALTSDFSGHFAPRLPETNDPLDMRYALSAKPRDYSPWPTLAPNAYSPIIARDDVGPLLGLAAYGQDVLKQHFYSAVAATGLSTTGYGLRNDHPVFGLTYQNDQFLPSLTASYLRLPSVSFYPLPAPLNTGLLWQDQQSLDLSARFPGIPFPLLGTNWVTGDSYVVGARALNSQNYNLTRTDLAPLTLTTTDASGSTVALPFSRVPTNELANDSGQSNSLYAMYQRADSFRRSYGNGPEGGSLSTIGYEKALPVLGGNASYDRVWGDYRRYVSLPWSHHVLALRGVTGLSWGKDGGYYTVGGSNPASFLSQTDLTSATSVFDQAVSLRGLSVGFRANKVVALSGEYRFPIVEVNKGLWTFPIYVDRLYGAVGYDLGAFWDLPNIAVKQFTPELLSQGASLELRSQLKLFQYLSTDLRTGVAFPIAPSATLQPLISPYTLIVGLGSTF